MAKSHYDTANELAEAACEAAKESGTYDNHRAAAAAHLAASDHAAGAGWHDEAGQHDRCAEKHISAMKEIDAERFAGPME